MIDKELNRSGDGGSLGRALFSDGEPGPEISDAAEWLWLQQHAPSEPLTIRADPSSLDPGRASVFAVPRQAAASTFVQDLNANPIGPIAVLAVAHTAAAGNSLLVAPAPSAAALAGTGHLRLNLTFDAAASAAPQSFRDAIQNATNLLDAAIYDNIVVNITVGYGEDQGTPLTNGGAEGDPAPAYLQSYATLRGRLAAGETSATDVNAVNSLPNASSLNGQTSFFVASAEQKALGLLSATASATDGYVGFATDIPATLLVPVALHEITHAMGRIDGNSVMGLFRFSSPGNRVFTSGTPAPSSYFSIDGGLTDLADFGIGSDASDWLNPPSSNRTPNDAFDEYYSSTTAQTLTSIDLTMLDVLGFDVTPPGLVDTAWYYATYPDVAAAGIDAAQHYHTYGWKEGRNPDPVFSTTEYLNLYTDVKAAAVDPLQHYDQYGWREGRDPSLTFDTGFYLAHYADIKAAGIDPLAHYLQYGQAEGRVIEPAVGRSIAPTDFDPDYYILANADVAAAGVDPYQHYLTFGWREGRNPNAFFNTTYYLQNNTDVANAGTNPLLHYDQFGWKEGRNPSPMFNTQQYLSANPDVAAAHIDPLQHYLTFGINEGRLP